MQGRLLPPVNNTIQAFPENGWQEEFALARNLGLDYIEFIFDGDNYARHPLMTKEGLREIQSLVQEHDVRILSVCADYFMTHPLHRGTLEERTARVKLVQALLRNCATLDVGNIIIPCVDISQLQNETEIHEFKIRLGECLPVAEDCGINLALETDLGPEAFTRLVRDIGHPFLKINYDTGNSASLGYDPVVELGSYGRWITDVHIKDRMFGGTTVPLGEGDADFPEIFSQLDRMNYNGIYILQTARKQPGLEQETIKDYLDFIGKYLP
ncbi:sugar phosphate isomerase/epimerase family protein [uncultured Methanoregula sp.]|uniref:sugar phosphate isomerase/epimerase family protein n=1 Tax=uncultured Methanoregula sp. TaxID=1005933 RepID=UPI002AABD021|nr:sugar phosphate isomerase/epimerase family protein [uncultured Methanoregula sp.]